MKGSSEFLWVKWWHWCFPEQDNFVFQNFPIYQRFSAHVEWLISVFSLNKFWRNICLLPFSEGKNRSMGSPCYPPVSVSPINFSDSRFSRRYERSCHWMPPQIRASVFPTIRNTYMAEAQTNEVGTTRSKKYEIMYSNGSLEKYETFVMLIFCMT